MEFHFDIEFGGRRDLGLGSRAGQHESLESSVDSKAAQTQIPSSTKPNSKVEHRRSNASADSFSIYFKLLKGGVTRLSMYGQKGEYRLF